MLVLTILGISLAVAAFISIASLSYNKAHLSPEEVVKGFNVPASYTKLSTLSWVPLRRLLGFISLGDLIAATVMGLGFYGFFHQITLLIPALAEIPVLGKLLEGPVFLIVWWVATIALQAWWFYELFGNKKLEGSRLPRLLSIIFLGAMSIVSFISSLILSGLLFALHTALAIMVLVYQEALIKENPGI